MNYCQKEEFLSKQVHRDVGDYYQCFYGAQESMSFSNIHGTVEEKVRS